MKKISLIVVGVLALTAFFVIYRLLFDRHSPFAEIAPEPESIITTERGITTIDTGSSHLTSPSPGPAVSASESTISDSPGTQVYAETLESSGFGPVHEGSGSGAISLEPGAPDSGVLGSSTESSGSGNLGPAPEASGSGILGPAPEDSGSGILGPAPEDSGSGILGPTPEAPDAGILGFAPEASDPGHIGLPPEVSGLGIPTEAPEATNEARDTQPIENSPEATPDRR